MVLLDGEQEFKYVSTNHNVEWVWVADLTSSHLIIPTKEFFTTYEAIDFGNIKLNNFSYLNIVGIGDKCSKINVSYTMTVKECLLWYV